MLIFSSTTTYLGHLQTQISTHHLDGDNLNSTLSERIAYLFGVNEFDMISIHSLFSKTRLRFSTIKSGRSVFSDNISSSVDIVYVVYNFLTNGCSESCILSADEVSITLTLDFYFLDQCKSTNPSKSGSL